jgi:hypothetical protein
LKQLEEQLLKAVDTEYIHLHQTAILLLTRVDMLNTLSSVAVVAQVAGSALVVALAVTDAQ